jgi:hypothetical protein
LANYLTTFDQNLAIKLSESRPPDRPSEKLVHLRIAKVEERMSI